MAASSVRFRLPGNFFASGAIGLIVFEIGGPAGAIIFAHGVDPLRILAGCMIMRERARIEEIHALRLGARSSTIIEKEFGVV